MTRLAGPIRQIGVIVHDIDAAIRHWCDNLGVGPFVVFRDTVFEDYFYRGGPSEAPLTTLAIGFSGSLQIEIIQQHNDAPSGYREFLQAGYEGMQHVSPWYGARDDYDAAYRRLLENGLECVHQGRIGDVRFAYFSRPDGGFPHLEISEALLPSVRPLTDELQKIAATWDGRRRVIEVGELPQLLSQAAP